MSRPEKLIDKNDPACAAAERINAKGRAHHWPVECDPSLQFRTPELNALRDLWHAKAQSRLPRRADFDARALKPVLRNLVFLDRIDGAAPRYRVRLLGSGLVRVFGEQTGRYLDEFIPPQHLSRMTELTDEVFHGGFMLRFVSRFAMMHLDYLDGETLMAPLADDAGAPCGILQSQYFFAKHNKKPVGL